MPTLTSMSSAQEVAVPSENVISTSPIGGRPLLGLYEPEPLPTIVSEQVQPQPSLVVTGNVVTYAPPKPVSVIGGAQSAIVEPEIINVAVQPKPTSNSGAANNTTPTNQVPPKQNTSELTDSVNTKTNVAPQTLKPKTTKKPITNYLLIGGVVVATLVVYKILKK